MRKHLSRIKGGRLAQHAYPARVVTIGISDVPGDDPAVIGSGPTVPDPTTLADASAIVDRYGLELPGNAFLALRDPRNETPKPNDPLFNTTDYILAAKPLDSFEAAENQIRAAGYEWLFLGDRVEGEAREVAAEQAKMARQTSGRRPPRRDPVRWRTYRHHPRSGPRRPEPGIRAGTGHRPRRHSGHCGPCRRHGRDRWRRWLCGRPGGSLCRRTKCRAGPRPGLDAAKYLADNNSTAFFAALGDLVSPGPTFTNVNDFRAIVVDHVDTA